MRSANTLLQLGVMAAVAIALTADAQATIYYVSPSGSDTNPGTSEAPFRTIKKAAKRAESGDTVYVAAGTYTDEIVVNGVQGSSTPAVFIGSSGAAVNARWRVVDSNYVQIKGFTFQGTSSRFLVWQDSYEGLIENCRFVAGDEGLLVKNGSVTINNCQIENFTYDGIQVDGEARVLVKDSAISGCQEAGVEIRKVAVVEFDNCTVSGQVGDGVKVDITEDSLDPGPEPEGWFGTPVPLVGSAGPIVTNNNSRIYGDVHRPAEYYVDPARVSGDIFDLDPDFTFPPVDPGDADTNNDNASLPLTDKGNAPLDGSGNFFLGGNDGIDLPPGTYYFASLQTESNSDLRVSGPTVIYVTGDILIKGLVNNSTLDPRNLQIFGMGSTVTIQSQSSIYAAIYAPSASLNLSGGTKIHGMVVANSLNLGGQTKIYMDPALEQFAESLMPSLPVVPAVPPSWTPISSGELDMTGSTFNNNAHAVRIVTPQAFIAVSSDFTSNAWGLRLAGSFDLTNCTASDNTVGGVWLTNVSDGDVQVLNLDVSNNTQYGVYTESCSLTFNSTNIADWAIAGSQIAIAGVDSDLIFDTLTISGGSTAGLQLSQGSLNATSTTFSGSGYGLSVYDSNVTLTSCTLSGNTVGLYAHQNATVDVTNTNISNNTSWGAKVDLTSTTGTTTTFSGSTVSGNANGISIVGATSATIALPNTVIQNNTNDGLRLDGSNLTLDASTSPGLQITNSQQGIDSVNSTLTLNGLSLSGHSIAAVYAVGGNLTVNNSTLSGSGYGISANSCDTVTLDNNCTLSGNTTGLYANQNTDLQVNSATLTGNSQWGASVNPKAGAGLCAIFDACTFHSNVGGLTLVNAVNGQVSLRSGTTIRDNTNSGLHFANCNLTVNDQAGGTAWRTLRNGYGISSAASTLTLSGISIEESSLYGVHCENSSVSLAGCTVTGVGGVYADATNMSLTVQSTRLNASNSGGWGVVRHGGDVVVKNCLLDGFDGGVYLSAAFSGDQAAVHNCTLVNLANSGVHLVDGDVTVQNTVLVGSSGANGLTQVSGQLTHSHNILDGFGTPFSGTTADATERLTNPRFVDAANGDYRLAKGSPAINSGTDLSASGITLDMLGNARPSHKVFEIGAYEFTQNGGSLRVLGWDEKK